MFGYIDPKEVNELRARIRKEDSDIRQGLLRLGNIPLNEMSEMIRNGMRKELQEKGVLPHGRPGTSPTNPKSLE